MPVILMRFDLIVAFGIDPLLYMMLFVPEAIFGDLGMQARGDTLWVF